MRVKVCGITSYEDAALALDLGADALGFNFFGRSPRLVNPADARGIIRRLPPLAVTVGIFVNVEDPGEVERTAREASVQVLQLHGDESPEYCELLSSWPLIKAIRIDSAPVEGDLRRFPVSAFLLDSRDDVKFGGTGRSFDWALAAPFRGYGPIILAGGLGADNVREAVMKVRPYGVDVCSAVESRPGRKDREKLNAFIQEVRDAAKNIW